MDSNILLIYTGGTVGMHKNPETNALAPVNFEILKSDIPELDLLDCNIEYLSFEKPIDSSEMNPERWVELAGMIADNYHSFDGFVILHGSDTMAYTASALSFLLENLGKPVILTGSQLPLGILRSDARENLMNSLEIASMIGSDGNALVQEVTVYFESRLYRGNRVFKNSSENFEAFESYNYPVLAESGVNLKFNMTALSRLQNGVFMAHNKMTSKVAVITLFPGITGAIINAVHEKGVKGIILQTYGSGNAPYSDHLFEAIDEAIKSGIKIANISQCKAGTVVPGKYESGMMLKKLGVLNGKDMTLEAGITKMMFMLTLRLSEKAFNKMYSESLKGELTN